MFWVTPPIQVRPKPLPAQILRVGDGQQYRRIELALTAAAAGSVIEVYPVAGGYPMTALMVTKPVILRAKGKVELFGKGYDYRGVTKTPLAMIEIGPDANRTKIQGFTVHGARNAYGTASGIRVDGADDVSISGCDIYDNDTGVASQGYPGGSSNCFGLRIDHCRIHANGVRTMTGQWANVMTGGDSIFLDHCLIWDPVNGDNLKTAARFTSLSGSILYGGGQKQIECVNNDGAVKTNSNLLITNCVLALDPTSTGSGQVISFGSQPFRLAEYGNGRGGRYFGGRRSPAPPRDGYVYLLQSTIYSESLQPIVAIESPRGSAVVEGCLVINPDPMRPEIMDFDGIGNVTGSVCADDWLSEGYSLSNLNVKGVGVHFGAVRSSTRAIPSMDSTGFALTGTLPLTHPLSYRDSFGMKRVLPVPAWKIGADPNLFRSLAQSLSGGR